MEQAGGKRSAWMSHVKKTMKANKGKSLMQVLKMAKKTYKKSRRGGGLSPLPLEQSGGVEDVMPVKGGRKSRRAGRKGSKKTRKH